MSKTIELPPLDFGGHSPEVCECDLVGGDGSCTIQPRYKDAYTQRCDQLLALLAEREQHLGEIEAYKEWAADVKRLTREIDVHMNGEEGAAMQASLCDVVGQVSDMANELSLLRATSAGWINCKQELPPDKVKVLAYRHTVYALAYRPQLADLDDMHSAFWRYLAAPPALPSKEGQ